MEQRWQDMSDRLSKLTIKQLKAICRDEEINRQWQDSRKDTLVARIVAVRRKRAMRNEQWVRDGNMHPCLKCRNVKEMREAGLAYKGESDVTSVRPC